MSRSLAFGSLALLAVVAHSACGSSGESPSTDTPLNVSDGGASGAGGSGQSGAGASAGSGQAGAATSAGGGGGATPGAGGGDTGGTPDAGGASGAGGESTGGGAGSGGGAAMVDADGDGIDDGLEASLAEEYLPYLALHPSDKCPLSGILYRFSPHPMDPSMFHVIYDHLYENDCGLGGHIGDDEVFAITIDPKKPAPDGILAMISISHQNTACQVVTECGVCPGQKACDVGMKNGKPYPVLYASQDKHGSYLRSPCLSLCLDNCSLPMAPQVVPLLNAGEPGAHLVEDLTAQGFITDTNGWKEMSLFHFNPWMPGNFGGAGDVSKDLVDPAFDTPVCP